MLAVSRKTVNAWENRKTPVGPGSQQLLRQIFGDDLLKAPAPINDFERGYWIATVEHIARQTKSILDQQLALAEKMQQPLTDPSHPTAATRATAIETVKRSAPAAADLPAPHTTPRRRRRG